MKFGTSIKNLTVAWQEWPEYRPHFMRGFTRSYFSHRTDPKPRPEGYRDHKLSRINSEWVQAGWSQGESGIPSLAIPSGALLTWYEANPEPVEALEASQTGEVPPEPSKGRGEAAGGVETEPDDCRTSTQVKFDLGFGFH